MTDKEATDLLERVHELERSNEALWAWVRALANQDMMVLKFATLLERGGESILEGEKIMKHITDNALYLSKKSSDNVDE